MKKGTSRATKNLEIRKYWVNKLKHAQGVNAHVIKNVLKSPESYALFQTSF
jgi:hypothetical protein